MFSTSGSPATTDGGIRSANAWVDTSTWFVSVACFNGLARNAFDTLYKGAPVVVFGTMRTNRWVDKDGVEHSRDELRATSVGPDLVRCTAKVARRQQAPVEEERIEPDDAFEGIDPDEAFEQVEEEGVPWCSGAGEWRSPSPSRIAAPARRAHADPTPPAPIGWSPCRSSFTR